MVGQDPVDADGAGGALRRRAGTWGFILLGVCLLWGYGRVLQGRALGPRMTVTWLGSPVAGIGSPLAFRFVGFDLARQRPLALDRVRVLRRDAAGDRELLISAAGVPILDLQLSPFLAPETVPLLAEVETEAGTVQLEARLEVGAPSALHLEPPSSELLRPFAFRGSPEPPPGILALPVAGRLSNSFPDRVWLFLRGAGPGARVQVNGLPLGDDPKEGGQVPLPEGNDGRLKLAVEAPDARWEGTLELKVSGAQIDVGGVRRKPERLEIEARCLSGIPDLYLDAWAEGGWFFAETLRVQGGRVTASVPIPPAEHGPVVIRLRDDPFGQGLAAREHVAFLGQTTDIEAALCRLPAGPGFWEEVGQDGAVPPAPGPALLTRTRAPDGPLPVLSDGRAAEEDRVAVLRARMRCQGLGAAGGASLLVWAGLAGLLLRLRRALGGAGRPRAGITLAVALAVAGISLGIGFAWLWWISAG